MSGDKREDSKRIKSRSNFEPVQKSASALKRSVWAPFALIDQGFFIFAGLASFWLAWLVWREGWHTGGWWIIGLFVVVWAITAYLALPRAHRILSNIYVPNYFIGRTRTADGLLGDPVNLALRGSEAQLHRAMMEAGWLLADEITPRSTWQMIASTLTRKSYDKAPVSSLYLFGRRQDFAYQQEVDGSPGKRHHVRFWRCPKDWLLPGGHRVDWLAAGTYDKSVGLSLFTLQITHKIDENTDIERDYIVKTVMAASPSVGMTNLEDFSTGYHSRNGGGDTIQTDGDLPVLELGLVQALSTMTERDHLILDATQHETRPDDYRALLQDFWSRRPPQISFGVGLVVLTTLVLLVSTIIDLSNITAVQAEVAAGLRAEQAGRSDADTLAGTIVIGSIAASFLWLLLALVFAWMVFRGANKMRLVLMLFSGLAIVVSGLSITVGKLTLHSAGLLLFIGCNIAIILMLSSDAARHFTQAHANSRRG